MYINSNHGDCTFKDQCQAVCKRPCEWGEPLRLIQMSDMDTNTENTL